VSSLFPEKTLLDMRLGGPKSHSGHGDAEDKNPSASTGI